MPAFKRVGVGLGDLHAASRWLPLTGYMLLGGLVLLATRLMLGRLGVGLFASVLGGIFCGIVFAIISFRYLIIPFLLWVLSVCGFRYIWSIQTPLLPDLYLDRMAMIWLCLVFMVKAVAERRQLRRPFRLDLLILVHALYLLTQIIFQKMEFFSMWTVCTLIPYTAYFMAKNIITKQRQIRSVLWALFALNVYYNVTSVAEKFKLDWLLWPKIMVNADAGWAGRSLGPFLHAPLFGTVIGMMLPIHLYFLATVKNTVWRIFLIASLLLGFAGLYFTYTRGSWLAGVVALLATALLNRKTYMKYLLPAAVLAPLFAVAVLGLAQDKFMKDRMENEKTIGSRLGTAVTVFRVWRDHPIFGAGFFQYRYVREDYIQPVELPGVPTIRFWQYRKNSIHDIYLGPLAETGLVGMGLQFAIYIAILNAVRRKFMGRGEADHVAYFVMPVFVGLFVGYLVGGVAIDYRFFSVVSTLFMVGAGILYGYNGEEDGAVATEG